MTKMKFWAVLHLLCVVLLIGAIVVLAVGVLDAFEWRYAVCIPILFVLWFSIMATFFKMYYDLGEWYGIDDSFWWLFIKYLITLCGGLCVWGIVVAIQILCGREE